MDIFASTPLGADDEVTDEMRQSIEMSPTSTTGIMEQQPLQIFKMVKYLMQTTALEHLQLLIIILLQTLMLMFYVKKKMLNIIYLKKIYFNVLVIYR
jgi:hypothetical protein